MLLSIAIILLFGLIVGGIFSKLKLPSLIGMIIVGIVLSPNALNLIDSSILNISSDLRTIALVIILTRAGLSLDFLDLKKVGKPGILMCFVPALFEILGTILIAPIFLGVNYLEAAIIGSVVAAVSPAVIVPRMIKLIEEGYGKEKRVPQLILAGASVDDVFVIVIFTALISLSSGEKVYWNNIFQVPFSIILGILLGWVTGYILVNMFKKYHMRDSVKVLVIISISFLLLELEKYAEGIVAFSPLISIMAMGIIINQKYEVLAVRLASKYNKLWVAAEIFLFVLVGASLDLKYAFSAGINVIILVIILLLFRQIGVWISLINSKLNKNEKFFCMIAYTPKATVQAAIGAIPYSMGLPCGQTVLTVAVLSILITAPIGAVGIDRLYEKLLEKNPN